MTFESTKTTKFWQWFESISADLLIDPTDSNLVSQIDSHILDLGHFDWEIGPWIDGSNYFTISPNLDVDKLIFTRQIIEQAPVCPGWHFLSSKPSKPDWRGIWKMTNEYGKEIWIDCSEWEYILYEFEDETFDMDIIITDIDCNHDMQCLAVDIGIMGYLGEENYMSLIKNIQMLDRFEDENKDKATLLKHIKKHMQTLKSDIQ